MRAVLIGLLATMLTAGAAACERRNDVRPSTSATWSQAELSRPSAQLDRPAFPVLTPIPIPTPSPMPAPAATPEPEPTPKSSLTPTPVIIEAAITFYACPPFCGTMRNGETVHEGAAACGGALAMGQLFAIRGDQTGREYVCADTGRLGWRHVDIFFWDEGAGWEWQAAVGTYGTVELR